MAIGSYSHLPQIRRLIGVGAVAQQLVITQINAVGALLAKVGGQVAGLQAQIGTGDVVARGVFAVVATATAQVKVQDGGRALLLQAVVFTKLVRSIAAVAVGHHVVAVLVVCGVHIHGTNLDGAARLCQFFYGRILRLCG